MFLYKEIRGLQDFLAKQVDKSQKVGFIPTMGSLHNGHITLIESCKMDGHLAVCSIFINPTQFNQQSDFDRYPREIEEDIALLEKAGCDVLFHPEPSEMYQNGYAINHFDYGTVTNSMEGFYRPGHFDGVITIVDKLLDVVKPHHLYMGQKDFQQCAVIRHMIGENKLPVNLHVVETKREPNGLAMSSRNKRLKPDEIEAALLIYKTLHFISTHYKEQALEQLKTKGLAMLAEKLKPEYLEIVDSETLQPILDASHQGKAVALIAAWCGEVRLIDNLIIE